MVNLWKPATAVLASQAAAAPTNVSNGPQSQALQRVPDRHRVPYSAQAVGAVAQTVPTVQYGKREKYKKPSHNMKDPRVIGAIAGCTVGLGIVGTCVGCGAKRYLNNTKERRHGPNPTKCDKCLNRVAGWYTRITGQESASPSQGVASGSTTAGSSAGQGGRLGANPSGAPGPTYPLNSYSPRWG